MNFEKITGIVMELTVLPFFPIDPAARLAIVRMVGAMAQTEDQVRWLVRVMTSGAYQKWEGPAEMRAVFCMKFRPKDGIESVSAVYPEGMTREQLNPGVKLQLEASPLYQISAGDDATGDPELSAAIEHKARKASPPPPIDLVQLEQGRDESDYAFLLRQTEAYRNLPEIKPITAEDVERAKAGVR